MADWAINGKFLGERMQGIVRYARELTKALDVELDRKGQVELVVPPNARDIPELKNIQVVEWGRREGIRWEQLDFRAYLKKHPHTRAINFCNTTPLFVQPGITTVHDVMYKANPQDYTTLRNKLSRLWHVLQYSYIAHHELTIITVSEFSKGEIERYYPKTQGKLHVIPNGWQHVLDYQESKDWQERYPQLKPGAYYFSMATLARNKNGGWVMEVARRNPEATFAIAGGTYEAGGLDAPSNMHLLGFVTDEDACALIKNCKAFLFPSFYEGFGLPPLEALALGAEVVASDTTALPEVLGQAVHYIDPYDACVDIAALQGGKPTGASRLTLERYSWSGSARLLRDVLDETQL